MDSATLKAMQAPLKDAYRNDADKALITLRARGSVDDQKIACKVETGRAIAEAGLHPATGGSGMELVLGRHAARSAGRLRRRNAEGGGDRAGVQARTARPSRPKAISISAVRWAWPRMRRSDFAPSGCASTSKPTSRRSASICCSSSPSATAWSSRRSTRSRNCGCRGGGAAGSPALSAPVRHPDQFAAKQ